MGDRGKKLQVYYHLVHTFLAVIPGDPHSSARTWSERSFLFFVFFLKTNFFKYISCYYTLDIYPFVICLTLSDLFRCSYMSPNSHMKIFISRTYALGLLPQNALPPPPLCMTSFMNYPWHQWLLLIPVSLELSKNIFIVIVFFRQ